MILAMAVLSAACTFEVRSRSAEPEVTGPDEMLQHVYIVHQPDSPVEIVSIDFSKSSFSAELGKVEWEMHYRVRIRNRSDRVVKRVKLVAALAAIHSGGRAWSTRDIAPGEEIDLENPGGHSRGKFSDDAFRILVAIESVALEDCSYLPSMSIPRGLPTDNLR